MGGGGHNHDVFIPRCGMLAPQSGPSSTVITDLYMIYFYRTNNNKKRMSHLRGQPPRHASVSHRPPFLRLPPSLRQIIVPIFVASASPSLGFVRRCHWRQRGRLNGGGGDGGGASSARPADKNGPYPVACAATAPTPTATFCSVCGVIGGAFALHVLQAPVLGNADLCRVLKGRGQSGSGQ